MNRLLLSVLVLSLTVSLSAGTLIYRTGKNEPEQVISKVKINSINREKNEITIEIGKGLKTLALSNVVRYYDTEISGGGTLEDNTPEYGVSIMKIDVPKRGQEMTKKKGSVSRSTAEIEMEYDVSSNGKTVKMPYFYLFVLTTSENEYGTRPVYLFSYPDEAKLRSSSSKGGAVYNEAQMLEKVLGLERPNLHPQDVRLNSGNQRTTSLGRRKAVFKLSGVGNRKIIAYHLVVWGKKSIVATKDWSDSLHNIGNRWWERR